MTKSSLSWAPEVIADDSGKWSRNGLRFATKEEADAWNKDLFRRWVLVREYRSVECDEPVTARWHFDRPGGHFDKLEML
jgi:hypothetical protein